MLRQQVRNPPYNINDIPERRASLAVSEYYNVETQARDVDPTDAYRHNVNGHKDQVFTNRWLNTRWQCPICREVENIERLNFV